MVKYFNITTGVIDGVVKAPNQYKFNNGEMTIVKDGVVRIEADDALILEWLDIQNCEPVEYPTYETDNYAMLRKSEYPDMAEFIDAHVKGDTVALQDYVDKCLAVKAKYPK